MLPDFLGIGAMRSGSSWLYVNLATHPQIWMPPIKEIHYFDIQKNGPFFNRCYKNHLLIRLKSYVKTTYRLEFGYGLARWDLEYFFRKRCDGWYQSLFLPQEGQIAGEITPAYSVLDQTQIKEIHKLNPNLKVLLLVRNPVDRAWSHVFKGLKWVKRPQPEIDDQAVFNILTKREVKRKGDYISILRNWESVFDREQIFVSFMEEIQQRPQDLFSRMCGFLGVDFAQEYFGKDVLDDKVHTSKAPPMPPKFKYYLSQQFLDILEGLNQRFGGYASEWYNEAIKVLAEGDTALLEELEHP